jgi:hypothetical protein
LDAKDVDSQLAFVTATFNMFESTIRLSIIKQLSKELLNSKEATLGSIMLLHALDAVDDARALQSPSLNEVKVAMLPSCRKMLSGDTLKFIVELFDQLRRSLTQESVGSTLAEKLAIGLLGFLKLDGCSIQQKELKKLSEEVMK